MVDGGNGNNDGDGCGGKLQQQWFLEAGMTGNVGSGDRHHWRRTSGISDKGGGCKAGRSLM